MTGSDCTNTKNPRVVATAVEKREKKKKNDNDMRRIGREIAKRYKSNSGAILHIYATSPNVFARITSVIEIKSIDCMTGDMVIGYGINNNGYVVDVLPDTFPGNIITAVTSWVKKVDKCNNLSTKISVK